MRYGSGRGNKYGNRRTFAPIAGREFDSKAEARRADELALQERVGEISALEYQPRYVLCTKPRISYSADFRYRTSDGVERVEDVKGVLCRETRVKLAWLREQDVDVVLLRSRRDGSWDEGTVLSPPAGDGPSRRPTARRPRNARPRARAPRIAPTAALRL